MPCYPQCSVTLTGVDGVQITVSSCRCSSQPRSYGNLIEHRFGGYLAQDDWWFYEYDEYEDGGAKNQAQTRKRVSPS